MNAVIYGLVDPFTGFLRYVGKTTKLARVRLRAHINDRYRCRRTAWIKSVRNRGGVPVWIELETVKSEDANDAEISMIAFVRSCGAELVNGTDGGDGMCNPTPEVRMKMSESRRKQPFNPKAIEAMRNAIRGTKLSTATKEKMSKAAVERLRNPELRLRISQKLKGHPVAVETRAKLSSVFRGFKRSAEVRRKIAEGNRRKAPRTEESKARSSIAIRRALAERKAERQRIAGQLSIFGE
jgi:hypothetical protein